MTRCEKCGKSCKGKICVKHDKKQMKFDDKFGQKKEQIKHG